MDIPFTDICEYCKEELNEIIVMQTDVIRDKDKIINELLKENKGYRSAIDKWREKQNEDYWG